MLRHLFKLIWNQKRQNFLLTLEIFVSFIVLFTVFSLIVYNYQNYKRPMGFTYKDVWVVRMNMKSETDTLSKYFQPIKQLMQSMPEIEDFSWSSFNTPFSNGMSSFSSHYDKKETISNIYFAEDSYVHTLGLTMLEGRWFNKEDQAAAVKPVIINRHLREFFFGNGPAIGKMVGAEAGKADQKIIGVVEDFKDQGDFEAPQNFTFFKINPESDWINCVVIKVKPGTGAAFEAKLFKAVSNTVKSANVEIDQLDKRRIAKNNIFIVPMVIFSIVAGFLIFNVSLGLFGVLWYNINRRKSEIGLRRAVGASGNRISLQFITESLVIASIAVILGLFFAVQFPILKVFDVPSAVYVTAMVLSVLFIYVLVATCALYPGKQAATIYPAVALHED
jgi:putative ABC transport system permease protein